MVMHKIPSLDALMAMPRDVATLVASARRKFTIRHPDGSPYITRWILAGSPALEDHDPSAPFSLYVHQLHTPDGDRHMHNHPWAWSTGLVLAGGYADRQLIDGVERLQFHGPGDLNTLPLDRYHTVTAVERDTFTLFSCGREVQDWGFLVDGVHVPHREYLAGPEAQKMYHTEDPL